MGLVELSVSDLDRSLAYWQDAVGLRVLSRENGAAELGADTQLVRLVEEPGAGSARGYTGLFHVALLLPDRPSLGRFFAHVVRERIEPTGLSDHVVSEAIYLRDPDYHGIEIYADRPREQWEGRVAETMTTLPLDTDSLLAEAGDAKFDGLPDGTMVEGVVDLAFREVDHWVVVDFKTDREISEQGGERYRRQVAVYCAAIARATGEPAVGRILRI